VAVKGQKANRAAIVFNDADLDIIADCCHGLTKSWMKEWAVQRGVRGLQLPPGGPLLLGETVPRN
jgi:hypothetical protein